MTVRALLVDDEAPARSELRHLLGAYADVEVGGEAATAREAVALAAAVRYDVVFLDIEMPGPSGLDLARVFRQQTAAPLLVFVTAYERYAVQAFAVEAFDYLLKPVDAERLARVVDRVAAARRPAAEPVEKVPVVSAGKTELVEYD